MRKVLALMGATAVASVTFAAGSALATQPYGNAYLDGTVVNAYVEDGHKVTICHRTGSASNPYVVITVDVAAIDGDGAADHDHHDQVGNGPLGDVIPPVMGYNDGKNWANNWAPGAEVTVADCTAPLPS